MRFTSKSRVLSTAVGVLAVALAVTGISAARAARKTAATRVAVTFTDRSLSVNPGILQSGVTTFVVRNTGKKGHVFLISGPGLKGARTALLGSGKTATLTVTLRTGSYMLADPIGLGPYAAEYVNVIRAASSRARGTGASWPRRSRCRQCVAQPTAPEVRPTARHAPEGRSGADRCGHSHQLAVRAGPRPREKAVVRYVDRAVAHSEPGWEGETSACNHLPGAALRNPDQRPG